jgi:hypothetical protein
LPTAIAVVTANGICPHRGGQGVMQKEEGSMQENLPLWVKSHAFKTMDKQNKQLKHPCKADYLGLQKRSKNQRGRNKSF